MSNKVAKQSQIMRLLHFTKRKVLYVLYSAASIGATPRNDAEGVNGYKRIMPIPSICLAF